MWAIWRFRGLSGCLLSLLSLSCCAANLAAQGIREFSSPTPASWHAPGNWTPAIVPTAADTAIVNHPGGLAAIATVEDNATALDLIVATAGRARIDHKDDLMNIIHRLTLGSAGGAGIYDLMQGQLVTSEIVLGDKGDGTLLLKDDTVAVASSMMTMAKQPGSVGLIRQRYNSTIDVQGDLLLGVGGTATLENRGGTTRAQRMRIGGDTVGGVGTYTFTSGPGDPLGTLEIGEEAQLGDVGLGTINISGETIDGGDAGILRVRADTGRLIGTGAFKIPVVFEDTVKLRFA